MTADLRERLDASVGDGPAHRPVEERLTAGRRAVRRRRRSVTVSTGVGLALLILAPVLLQPTSGAGGGIGPSPSPSPTIAPTPGHVRLLVAPPRYVNTHTPAVLYLFGRLFRRDRLVDVLATYGEIDAAAHPQAGAIVRIGRTTRWVLVVGNEPESIHDQRAGPYDYPAFMAWAASELHVMSRRLARATATR